MAILKSAAGLAGQEQDVSILVRLRQATAAEHEAIEAGLGLGSPELTPERYVALLQFFGTAFVPWEKRLAARCPAEYRALWEGREKTFRVAEDLRSLGAEPRWTGEAPAGLPEMETTGEWLGSLYVMEGSTLGGQFIARHLESHFGWRDGAGYSYFQGYGTETGPRWRAVGRAIESSGEAANQIFSGAHQTYDYLLGALQRYPCP